MGRDLEEIDGWFDCHRGEINCLKIREKDAKEEVEKLEGFIIGAGAPGRRACQDTWCRAGSLDLQST